jgi:hypothetical protein
MDFEFGMIMAGTFRIFRRNSQTSQKIDSIVICSRYRVSRLEEKQKEPKNLKLVI